MFLPSLLMCVRRHLFPISLCLLVVGIPAVTLAQRTFRSKVEMVALTVTVTDEKGLPVNGLTADDFAVFEDGVPQQLSLFGSEEVPLDVLLVLDTSSSMGAALPIVKKAAIGLVQRLRPGDRAGLVNVKNSISIPEPLSDSHERVAAAVHGVDAKGSTALYDGVYTSLREFERDRRARPDTRRQALVVLSDGIDTASHVGFDDMAELARMLDVVVYTITVRNSALPLSDPAQDATRLAMWQMKNLAFETGGLAFLPVRIVELPGVYDTIARELTHQYALGYVASSPRQNTAFRRVALKLLPPAQGVPRTRTGYLVKGSSGPRLETLPGTR